MGNAVAESPAPPYKDRRGWLVAFGVIEILLGTCCLPAALLAIMSLVTLVQSHTTETPAGIHTAGIAIGAGFDIVIAAFFFVAGIGSILRRNWARILMLIGSAVWLLVGTLTTVLLIFLKIMTVQHPLPPAAQDFERIMITGMLLPGIVFGILLPLTFLIFYSRKSVKATCLAREGAPAAAESHSRKLPVPVIIMLIWEALGAVSALFLLVSPMRAACLFGYILRGWSAIVLILVFSVLSATAAWLIYRKRLAGWTIALWKLLFFGASAGVSLATGSMSRLFVEMSQAAAQERFAQLFPQFITVVMVATLIMCAAYLVLLIYSRRFFLPAIPSPTS